MSNSLSPRTLLRAVAGAALGAGIGAVAARAAYAAFKRWPPIGDEKTVSPDDEDFWTREA